jgi:uncharacterized membrane protein
MSPRPLLLVTGAVVAVQIIVAAWTLTQVEPTAPVPVHWNLEGSPDGYADAWLALSLAPAMTLLLGVLLAFIPRLDPRRANLERSATAYRWITGTALVFLGGVQLLLAAGALGASVEIPTFLGMGVGVLFVVIGNFLGKTRPSWFLGIRTPWTLSSDLSWRRTHRLGGYLFVVAGVLAVASALLLPPEMAFWVLMVGIGGVLATVVPFSYLVWRSDPDRRTL